LFVLKDLEILALRSQIIDLLLKEFVRNRTFCQIGLCELKDPSCHSLVCREALQIVGIVASRFMPASWKPKLNRTIRGREVLTFVVSA